MEPSNLMVIGLGMGTVFFGLICLIVICKVMSFFVGLFAKKDKNDEKADAIPNKSEILAAVCAAIAEETGADTKNIRVTSFKRV